MATVQTNGSSAVTKASTKNNGGAATRAGSSALLDNVNVSTTNVGVFASTVIDNEYADKALSAGVFRFDNQRPVGKRITNSLATVSNTVLQSGALLSSLLRGTHKRESYKVSKVLTAYRNGYWDPYSGIFTINGSYSRTGTTVTVTAPKHGLASNDFVTLDFTSGAATDGRFQVTVTDANTFTVTHGTSGSTSGNLRIKGVAYATETVGSDTAATSSRATPGKLVYRAGARLPVRDNYKAKNG